MAQKYYKSIKRTTHDNSLAFGYSITITGTVAALSSLEGAPSWYEILAGSASAAIGFAVLQLIAGLLITEKEEKNEKTDIVGNSLSFLSVSAAVSSALLISLVAGKTLTWILSPFTATVIYTLTTALQISVVGKIKQKNR
jgi:hypothetical protein